MAKTIENSYLFKLDYLLDIFNEKVNYVQQMV